MAEHQPPDNANSVEWTRGFDNVVAYHLRRAQEASFAAFVRRVGDDHIWPGWYSLLKIIHDNPGINQTELSQATGRDKSTLTASLRELDKAGMVVRMRDEGDRRNFRIYLSEQGENYLGERLPAPRHPYLGWKGRGCSRVKSSSRSHLATVRLCTLTEKRCSILSRRSMQRQRTT